MRIVRSIRIKENLWEVLRTFSRESGKPISHIIEESAEEYLGKRRKFKAVETLQQLPNLSLGGKTVSRKEIYEGRY